MTCRHHALHRSQSSSLLASQRRGRLSSFRQVDAPRRLRTVGPDRRCTISTPSFRLSDHDVDQLGVSDFPTQTPDEPRPTWSCTWHTGPDAGATTHVGPGDHWIGGAAGAVIRCDDTTLEPHHALLRVEPSGAATLTQCSGRVPIRVDGHPLSATVDMATTTTIGIARSTLRVERLNSVPATSNCSGRGAEAALHTVVRTARALPEWHERVIATPSPPSQRRDLPGGLVMGVLGLVIAGVMATTMHQPMYLLIGGLGAVATIGAWITARVRSRRTGRSDRRRHASALADFDHEVLAEANRYAAHVRRTVSTPRTAWSATVDHAQVWSRRGQHPDAFVVSVGTAEVHWHPTVETNQTAGREQLRNDLAAPVRLTDLPITTDLGAGACLGLRGNRADTLSVARSLLLQLTTNCGPADVRVVIATDAPHDWAWFVAAPHNRAADRCLTVGSDELAGVLAALDHPHRPHIVLLVDEADALTTRTGPARRALGDASIALVAVADEDATLAHLCTAQLHLAANSTGMSARWVENATVDSLPQIVTVAGVGSVGAARLAASLGRLVDPEDPLGDNASVPRAVGLYELLTRAQRGPLTAANIASHWRSTSDAAPRTPLGLAADGIVDLDLVRDGPHGLLAGTTGAGKSELLRSLVIGLAVTTSPQQLNFVLVDYKGGATFDGCAALPHVVGVITDLDDHLADRALRSLQAELRHREELLRAHSAADLSGLRAKSPEVMLPRLVVVIDEFAALVCEQPTFLPSLVGIAQRGRSLGVHLLLATQRPAGVISDDIRANTNLRIALRLHDAADALDVLGDTGPALIGRGLPGRAMMRLGPDEIVTFQTASCTVADDQQRLVTAIREAAVLAGIEPQRQPWLPELPTSVTLASTLPQEQLGLIDDPDRQRRMPLQMQQDHGNLLIVAGAGMGASSALIAAARADTGARHLYVIDAAGGHADLVALAGLTRCGAVVAVHERERLSRLLHRLDAVTRGTAPPTPMLLLVDGLDRLRTALDDAATMDEFEALERLLSAPSADLLIVATTRRASALPSATVAAFPQRWLMHLADDHDAAHLGVSRADLVTAAIPGRVLIAALGLHGQLAALRQSHPADEVGATARTNPPPMPIRCLPAVVDAAQLPAATRDDDAIALPLGLAFTSDSPISIEVPRGEHVLVIGPSRSGKTTALIRVASAWRNIHPAGRVVVVQPCARHRPAARQLAALADRVIAETDGIAEAIEAGSESSPTLLVVDDAELTDDTSGALAALIHRRRSGLLVVAAAKPDALRQAYGHWTGTVRRSRLGIVAAAGGELDGDLLGVMAPRRLPVAARAGLVWLIDNGTMTLCQLAVDRPASTALTRASGDELHFAASL